MDPNFLLHTLLFKGVTAEELTPMLGCLRAEEKSHKKGEVLYRAGDRVHTIGLLLTGALSIENDDLWGNKTVLGLISPGQVFAESYACVPGEQLMVSVVAVSPAQVLYLEVQQLLQTCSSNCPYHGKLIRNLLTISAQKNLNLSRRSFHTAPKSIRGRLLSYLSYEATRQGCYEFDIPFNRQQLADYLGVDRSALSGELGKMASDGLLTTTRSHFTLSQDSVSDYQ